MVHGFLDFLLFYRLMLNLQMIIVKNENTQNFAINR